MKTETTTLFGFYRALGFNREPKAPNRSSSFEKGCLEL